VGALEREMKQIEYELENNMNLNNLLRNEKKRRMQALMIQRNKLLKQ
jgi:hypothetical protein